jgi:hypothetical protein
MFETSATVLGGLSVDISFSVAPAEPDVGIMSSYVDEWSIVGINGKAKKNTDWIMKRLTAADEERILEACNEFAGEEPDDDREPDYDD